MHIEIPIPEIDEESDKKRKLIYDEQYRCAQENAAQIQDTIDNIDYLSLSESEAINYKQKLEMLLAKIEESMAEYEAKFNT